MTFEEMIRNAYQQTNNSQYYQNQYQAWTTGFGRPPLDEGDKLLLKQIKQDVIEYFISLKLNLNKEYERRKLTKVQKERVVAFMKNRLNHYLSEGFLI